MTTLDLSPLPRRKRPSLTPMIDVVFLLLVFFMLAARFGLEGSITLTPAGGASDYAGPPRLVEINPSGFELNGRAISADALPEALDALMQSPDDAVLVRAQAGVPLQMLTDLLAQLQASGMANLVVVE